ncbi:bifunctional hydroxymethylpyrimidine kinase/phosphomethylpyrimidine kinase [Roseovarius sp.]|uniref:bifunctional hydroxymethylpyrimidine kinase/phosphomethylpyrimidine kinase n=1 Tax=Roseovarius sp. TaxID=1486281 RepID=UPI0026221498|nr:bifunctional hydroxymethylpyrimidine kinase/phosphomethylpyrimidine kinase [Roseovarius sp.]MDM8167911.1 bifunctional hydroxymethylpyrimidine kinase/phosphomethylpyrimidine kinase [Roseovarius sp.]
MEQIAKLLVIAGSDSGGGAGIQADIKTASALGVYAATALTAITAQNTRGVRAVEMLSPGIVGAQISAVLEDIGIGAVKIGMLGDAGIVDAVADALAGFDGPVVLDPVMVAKSGDALLADEAVAAVAERLLPMSRLLTPNLPEAARLLGRKVATTPEEVRAQGAALRAMGAGAVLMKGGHAEGPVCRDVLVTGDGGAECEAVFEAPRLETRNTHGTGCSLSSAVAAELAKGATLVDSVGRAHGWLHGAIAAADGLGVGHGQGPVHHFHEVW